MKQFALLLVVFCVLSAQAAPDRTSRIINGQVAANHPSNAYIVYTREDGYGYFGGGTIISDRHILTTALIIDGFFQWDVGMGSNILSMLGFVTSRTATAHPQYNPVDRANDIGVITLPVSLVITANVAPIALPPLDSVYGYPFENEQGTIVGFGFTDAAATVKPNYLMRAYQRVTNDIDCQIYPVTAPNHFCAKDIVEGGNLCNGDLGAGFITDVHGQQTITGVASMIMDPCANSHPTAYTRVEAYRTWINTVTGV
ncbi:inactive CLIP domain-containing serine protease A8-like [Aedes albopictus]|uniref:Peptidase S1 domain-containing protein n=1 Tax=Aedes albopictus TaxID=7160 RepID=A0ABM1ZI83_AEDAL